MRYKEIADQLIDDIEQKRLQQGGKMPSLRQITRLFSVSMSTALNCYHLLEELGWISAKPQSGFYVTRPMLASTAPESPSFQPSVCKVQPQQHLEQSGLLGPLGVSRLGESLLPLSAWQQCIKRGIKRIEQQWLSYPPAEGVQVLRQLIAQFFHLEGFPVDAEELIISQGCLDAVRLALTVCTTPGDTVVVSSPCYSGLLALLGGMQRNVIEIPCTSEGLDLVYLEQLFASKTVAAGLFSTSHMNPNGMTLSLAQKKKLAKLANLYKVPVIEDDVYISLSYQGGMPMPAKYWDEDGYVIWCSSVSKTLSAGVRLGWCWAGRYTKAILARYAIDHFGAGLIEQASLIDFIDTGQYRTHLHKARLTLGVLVANYRELLQQELPNNISISAPTGGTVLWLHAPELDSERLVAQAHAQGIHLLAGNTFSTQPVYSEYFRVNAGVPLEEELPDALLSTTAQYKNPHEQLLKVCELVRENMA